MSPSKAVPDVVPNPGKDVLALFAVIAFAWEVVIVVVLPASAVVEVVPKVKLDVPAPIVVRTAAALVSSKIVFASYEAPL